MYSVGVSRQYCGRIGKVDNCQVGVYLGYETPTGTTFVDRRLYLPKVWCEDGL
jgi:SRSO17 transposase